MSVKAAVIIAVRRDDGTIEYYASTDVQEFHVRGGGLFVGADFPPNNSFHVRGVNLQPWDPSQGMPQPPQVALPAPTPPPLTREDFESVADDHAWRVDVTKSSDRESHQVCTKCRTTRILGERSAEYRHGPDARPFDQGTNLLKCPPS